MSLKGLISSYTIEGYNTSLRKKTTHVKQMKKIAIYPGSFDPITNGHLDVLKRACQLFDNVIVAITQNTSKIPIFSRQDRIKLIEENIKDLPQAQVLAFEGLTVDLAQEKNAQVIIRGLRAVSDFEYEFQLTQMNRHLNSNIETIFLMPSQDHFYTSSQLIKAVAKHQVQRIQKFVPANVLSALENHFEK